MRTAPTSSTWRLSDAAHALQPSAVRNILQLTQNPEVLSLAGGLPAPEAFPVEALAEASARVWRDQAHRSLQYSTSEGLPALRQWVADHLRAQGHRVQAEQVLITTGSQQGLDLLGKVLIDPGQPVCMGSPTYLGAVQSFSPYRPQWLAWRPDHAVPPQARLAYAVPNFHNPTAHAMGLAERLACVQQVAQAGVPLIEDDPYGALWYDQPPPPSLASLAPDDVVHLGSWSKVLAPGLRLGFLVCPASRMDTLGHRLLLAKQGADLHTSTFDQALVLSLLQQGFSLEGHLQQVRARYRQQRDAMAQALQRHMPPGWHWALPEGGMFFWVQGPPGTCTTALLPRALAQGVAYVPGAAFDLPQPGRAPADAPSAHCMRLSFVTLGPQAIDEAVRRLSQALIPLGDVSCSSP
ncbi:PLP-dependent aminotransferase family protein [Aquabacterium lacunae]|uniref:PLP-dependent aminotransferase family protein n=1 Tax=Aquabacterium lacunae TaxID=2528630 RepID=A0A4Q9GZI4_9BURK|nr:PLP-dependent aminotransferase family protein [Aquabacterium lacunae]TBO30255.1 PLP-dependent aminotransferase family protein [Aquabacterium lacunae]